MFRHSRPAALTAAAILTAGLAVPAVTAAAAPSTAADCVKAGLVWVHVEFDAKEVGACADKFGTAQEALLDTGLATAPEEFLTTIAGRTADAGQREWWSIYTLSPVGDTYPSGWDFAQVGASQLTLSGSDVLGIVLQPDWNVDAVAPAVNPVEGVSLGEEPTPSPSPSESASPTPSASPSQSVTPQPSASATTKPSKPGVPSTGV